MDVNELRELRTRVRDELTGPGAPFEIVEENVLGERMPVFKSRKQSLREMLAESTSHGDKDYIVHDDRRITYQELVPLVASTAHELRGRYGIGPGDRVAILAANSPEWVLTFWATVCLGGIVSALNGWWAADEIRYGVEHSQPRLLVGDRRRLERVAGFDLGVPVLEIESDFAPLLERRDVALPEVAIGEDDPAVILYTSGTTGRPKGAVVSHRAIVGFVQTNSLQGLERVVVSARSDDAGTAGAAPTPTSQMASLVTVPLFHLSGLYAAAVMMLAVGAKTVYRSGRFDPEDVLRLIEREKITTWSALGDTGHRVVSHPSLGRYDVSSIQNIGFGGAPTSPALQEKIREAFPGGARNVGMGYGLSESGGLGAALGGDELLENPTATGRPSPTHQLQIRDAENKVVPDGVEGEIHIRSPYLMLEYWRDPEATSAALKPGRWLATGDIGHLVGGLLYINSRARDMILRAAENIHPVEIEHRLDAHPQVGESAVVGVDHETLGQEVKAIVVPIEGASLEPDELASWVSETLAAYKVPSLWEIRSQPLPRTPSGKVLKTVLTGEAEDRLVAE